MKNYLYFLVVVCFFFSCDSEEIKSYSDQNYVQFTNIYKDTIKNSFFFYYNQESIELEAEVELIGNLLKEDTKYNIKIIEEETDVPAESFELASEYIFRANQTKDTLRFRFHNNPLFKDKKFKLVFQLETNEKLCCGQTAYIRQVYIISDIIEQPTWWDEIIVNYYLGEFSVKKFEEFMRITGKSDLSKLEPEELVSVVHKFKNELARLKEAGTPLTLEDGSDMYDSITLIG